MNKLLIAALLALCLTQTFTQNTKCSDEGFQDTQITYPDTSGTVDKNPVKCYPCSYMYKTCVWNTSQVTLIDTIPTDSYSLYTIPGNNFTTPMLKCQTGWYYNTQTGNCDVSCQIGCVCQYSTNFCISCDPGFYWSEDFKCAPLVSGLEIASLVILVIALVFCVMIVVRSTTGK